MSTRLSNRMELHDQDALVNRFLDGLNGGRPTVFLVGSALTAPPAAGEPGVPGTAAMLKIIRRRLRDPGSKIPTDGGGSAYQQAFPLLDGHRGPEAVNRVVREAVLAALDVDDATRQAVLAGDTAVCRALEKEPERWRLTPGVEALGQLLAHLGEEAAPTVLTTNFDPLIQVAIRKAGGRCWDTVLPLDGSLGGTSADGCRVVHLHGSWCGQDTLHTPSLLTASRPRLTASLRRLLDDSRLITVAYEGWDDVLTEAIREVVEDAGAAPEILWTFYRDSAAAIRAKGNHFIDTLVHARRVTLYGGIDAHALFPHLVDQVGVSTPGAVVPPAAPAAPSASPSVPSSASKSAPRDPWIVGPPIRRDEDFFGRHTARKSLKKAVAGAQPVQILGERRMGKTSLLLWAERHVREWVDVPVVRVNAQGPDGMSPGALVLEVARQLGREGEVDAAALDEVTAAAQALGALLPCCLLVDEADFLTAPERGFKKSFLDTLRSFGQAGRLRWVSVARSDLHEGFRAAGFGSLFLNDSEKLWMGHLEEAAVRALLERGLGAEPVEPLLAEVAGFPYLAQWLGRAVAGGVGWDRAVDELELAMAPIFRTWWGHRDGEERAALRRVAVVDDGVEVAALERGERLTLRGLERLGLVVDREGWFEIPGAVWRRFVVDVSGEVG